MSQIKLSLTGQTPKLAGDLLLHMHWMYACMKVCMYLGLYVCMQVLMNACI